MATEKAGQGQARGFARLSLLQKGILAAAIVLWMAVFLAGTLIDSSPFRTHFAAFEGGLGGTVLAGAVVGVTYTLTNVGILCLLASLLGCLGSSAGLGTDAESSALDETEPLCSAILRGFLVYLAVIAGVLMVGDSPAAPTQEKYVRLAGFISLVGFAVNYRPELFAGLLARLGKVFEK
jgi:hypothetical protein